MQLELIEQKPGTTRYNHYIFRNLKEFTCILGQLTIIPNKGTICEYELVDSITSKIIESRTFSINNLQFDMNILELIYCNDERNNNIR